MEAIELVRPLVEEGVRLYDEWQTQIDQAELRRVNPQRSPAVAQSYARLMGACELLSAMWRQMGMNATLMTPDAAFRAVRTMTGPQSGETAPDPDPVECWRCQQEVVVVRDLLPQHRTPDGDSCAGSHTSPRPTVPQLVAHVQQFAQKHYGQGGWDVIIEAYTDEELAELLAEGGVTTHDQAIELVGSVVGAADEVRLDRRPQSGVHY